MKKKQYIGEKRLNNDGAEMVIIDAINAHRLTVRFTDSGNIREGCYYGDFCRGMIKDRVRPTKEQIVGQKAIMNCGSTCEVIDYFVGSKRKHAQVTVKFENGCIKTTDYGRFVRGEISDKARGSRIKPQKTSKRQKRCERFAVGKTIVSKGGIEYTITACYEAGRYVDVIDEKNNKEYHKSPVSILQRREKALLIKEKVVSVIGEKSLTSSLRECEIVGGTKLCDLDIKLSDGSILHHQIYAKFKNGTICEKDGAKTTIARKRYEYIGKTVLQSCGLEAKCVQYNNRNDITVEFSDGTKRNTSTDRFNHGDVVYNPEIKKGSLSINEYTLQQCLKNAGFVKMPCGSLKHMKGFGNKELDLYHPKYKIAIEYDGFYHRYEENIRKDILKDELCRKNGVAIYRIRERGVPALNDGISTEYQLSDNHPFNPNLRDVISKLSADISQKVGTTIIPMDLTNVDVKDRIVCDFAKNGAYLSRIGEVRYNRDGERMQIFDYLSRTKVGIIFDNGYTTWRDYQAFKEGKIKCLCNHYGETSVSRNGQLMQIVSSDYGQKVTIKFEDGTLVERQEYNKFLKGLITNPNFRKNKDLQHIGEVVQASNGLFAEIISVKRVRPSKKQSVLRVVAQFEDGELSPETEYHHFKSGYVKHP